MRITLKMHFNPCQTEKVKSPLKKIGTQFKELEELSFFIKSLSSFPESFRTFVKQTSIVFHRYCEVIPKAAKINLISRNCYQTEKDFDACQLQLNLDTGELGSGTTKKRWRTGHTRGIKAPHELVKRKKRSSTEGWNVKSLWQDKHRKLLFFIGRILDQRFLVTTNESLKPFFRVCGSVQHTNFDPECDT